MAFCTRAPVSSTPRPSTFLCSFSHASSSPSPQPKSSTRVSGSTNSPMIAKSRRPYTSRTGRLLLERCPLGCRQRSCLFFKRVIEESAHQLSLLLYFHQERIVPVTGFQIAIRHVRVAAAQRADDLQR